MATYDSVNDKRKKNWAVNALRYNWMKAFPGKRNSSLWLFSSWEGQKYADNSRYLFEYMLANHPEITCIWQTRNQAVFDSLKRQNKPVQMIGTLEATKAQKEAGVVFYTNGLDDFGDFPQIYGATVVSLWHGIGFKKGYRELYHQTNKLKRIVSDQKWNFFSWVKRDITVVTSEESKRHFIDIFALDKKSSILIAGQPRNDVFAESVALQSVLKNTDVLKKIGTNKVVLYMPTFRKKSEALMSQLEELWSADSFERMLEENNAVFLTKLHYLNRGNLQQTSRKILLNDSDVVDVQKLMCCADMLVTDYSSCGTDYALQNKPVLFYFPDWKEYDADNCMQEIARDACSINCATTAVNLEDKIKATLIDPQNGIRQSEKLNQLFDGTGVKCGEYSENVYRNVMKLLRVNR